MKYNFIIRQTPAYSLSELRAGNPLDFTSLFSRGDYCWSLLTYLMLKNSGLDISLSHVVDCKAINLAHGNVLRELNPAYDVFCVSLQADFPRFPLAQYHIVQNMDQVTKKATYIPHWPQVGLSPRDSKRCTVQTVAYQGRKGFSELIETNLATDLNRHGMEFKILDMNEWGDLFNIDILLGIRGFGRKVYHRKPPSKMVNAWHAGIPFIGGMDSAFSQVGLPEDNFIQVSSYEEMLDKILLLKNDPRLYKKIVEQGMREVSRYSFDAITQRWVSLLKGDIESCFLKWQRSEVKKGRFRIKQALYRMDTAIHQGVSYLYDIEVIKRVRDRYYDPVN